MKAKQSEKILKIAKLAGKVCQGAMDEYSCAKSPQRYTQPQLLAVLIMKTYLRLTYRGVIGILELSPRLQRALRLKEVPDFSTLQKFGKRAVNEELANKILGKLIAQLGARSRIVAMDSTGLEPTAASAHFVTRSGRDRKRYVKVAVIVLCGSLLPCAVAIGRGPCNDKCEAPRLLEYAASHVQPQVLVADAGFDAEWIHEFCYDNWGVESFIPPVRTRGNTSIGGFYRSEMEFLPPEYGKRWNVESFMSGFKRMTDSRLRSRSLITQTADALLKILAYAVYR